MNTLKQLAGNSDQKILTEGNAKITEGKKKLTSKVLTLVDRKFLAARLGVSESMICQWINGSKSIPAERVFEILKSGKFFCRDWRGFEDEIDLALWGMGE